MKVVIFGAGSIGCYIGAILHQQNMNVHLLGRERIKQNIEQAGGMTIGDYEGRHNQVSDIAFSCTPEVMADADVVLVTLKCTAIAGAIEELRHHCPQTALIVCMQNGVGSTQQVQQALPEHQVMTGIVPFNVVQTDAAFYRATEGALHFPIHSALLPVQGAFQSYGLGCELNANIDEIVWGKLLLNLNNAINALADIPLKEELSQRPYRLVLAACQRELLNVCRKKGIKLAKLTAVKPDWIPFILSLPDVLFKMIAQKMLAIDPKARSSMWEDVQMGRATEIDYLNGAVVRLAEEIGEVAPANQMVLHKIKAIQPNADGRSSLSGDDLLMAYHEMLDA